MVELLQQIPRNALESDVPARLRLAYRDGDCNKLKHKLAAANVGGCERMRDSDESVPDVGQ